MVLTKLKSFVPGKFEYVNMDEVEFVEEHVNHYDVYVASGEVLCIDITDTVVSGLIATANTNYI